MEHLERPKKFGFELPLLFCLDVVAIEPDFLTWCIAQGFQAFVMSLHLEVLRMQKVLATNVDQLPQFHSQFFGWGRFRVCIALVFKRNTRIVVTVELKKCVTCISILGVVIGKLRYWEKWCLIILLQIYKNIKVSFHSTVLLLRLTVSLRVECGGKFSLNAEEVTEQEPKLERKNCFPVTYDGVREAMMLYHHVYDYFC